MIDQWPCPLHLIPCLHMLGHRRGLETPLVSVAGWAMIFVQPLLDSKLSVRDLLLSIRLGIYIHCPYGCSRTVPRTSRSSWCSLWPNFLLTVLNMSNWRPNTNLRVESTPWELFPEPCRVAPLTWRPGFDFVGLDEQLSQQRGHCDSVTCSSRSYAVVWTPFAAPAASTSSVVHACPQTMESSEFEPVAL